ncbi:hypothetical protein KKC22_01275, partial [Myxococcota bacterium]|nr:hypothetical protein [Myxococcota bacterium]
RPAMKPPSTGTGTGGIARDSAKRTSSFATAPTPQHRSLPIMLLPCAIQAGRSSSHFSGQGDQHLIRLEASGPKCQVEIEIEIDSISSYINSFSISSVLMNPANRLDGCIANVQSFVTDRHADFWTDFDFDFDFEGNGQFTELIELELDCPGYPRQ